MAKRTELTFTARFSYADDSLHFIHSDQSLVRLGLTTRAALIREATPADAPLREFAVKMPRGMPIDEGVIALIGYDCKVTVTARNYAFPSNYARNAGEIVTGATYTLVDIERAIQLN